MKRLLALALVLSACSGGSSSHQQRTITVFAAASLNRAFTGMARAFQDSHPGLQVELSFAGSQSLAAQVREGAQADVLAAGAEWRDPAQVDQWAQQLPAGTPVVVYCVYGHEVGRATALRLRASGVDARFLVGGFDGWRSQGRPVVRKAAG